MLKAIDENRIKNAKILVVDDLKLSSRLIVGSLNSAGFSNITIAQDGVEALMKTRELRPDIVLLDLMMPIMDGFEYCTKVREDASFDGVPIIVQTALNSAGEKLRAFNVGANDYICKPLIPSELIARTKLHLANKLLLEDLTEYHSKTSVELDAARQMQSRIMPNKEQIALAERVYNMQIAHHFETSSELGGDCWGMRAIDDHHIALYMFDFSGHGISAALNVFRMHSIMQDLIHNFSNPGSFLEQLNKQIHSLIEKDEFATMFYGIIDTDANCLSYATAASPAALIYSTHDNDTLSLNGRGFPLGASASATYETFYAPYCPGDLLLLYSDCLIETRGYNHDVIKENKICEELERSVLSNTQTTAKNTIEKLLQLFVSHSDAPIMDDITMTAYFRNKV